MDTNGSPVDIFSRNSIGKQLKMPGDAKIIADYSNPEFVLGWNLVVVV
jgi:hypothetical protein